MARLNTYICFECEEPNTVKYAPKINQICKTCNDAKKSKPRGSHVRYWYFCPKCPSVRMTTQRKKTANCGACCRILNKKRKFKWYFDFETMKGNKVRYFRICPECESSKEVAPNNAGIKLCRACSYKSQNKTKGDDYKKPRKKKYSQVGTDGAKHNKVKVRFQIVDESTMEAPRRQRKEKEIPQCSRQKEIDMMAEWLSKNKINKL